VHDHENVRETEDPQLVARNTRTGLWLFLVYLALYAGFMGLSTFAPTVMQARPFGGLNLALIYGFGLIVSALVLAVIYLWLCHRPVAGQRADTAGKES
jgi:uncharacterized membrane protein (DUF485 family)